MSDTNELKYTKTHEWVRIDGDKVTVGITQHAEEELGDVALIQLPEVGRMLQRDETFGEIESIKAVSELYAPVSGEVIEVNEGLASAPELVNSEPYDEGWLIRMRLSKSAELSELLDAATYQRFVEEL